MKKLFFILFLAPALCHAQGAFTLWDSAAVAQQASKVVPIQVDWLLTFQGGTNGSQMSTNALTNSLSLYNDQAPGTWAAGWSVFAAKTNIDTSVTKRFLFDNTSVPPSPYSTFSIPGVGSVKPVLTFANRYNCITNWNTGISPVETSEDLYWTFPSSQVNVQVICDFMTSMDNTSGGAATFDILYLTGASGHSVSLNLHQGQSGTTNLFMQLEVDSKTGGAIPIVTNKWYRADIQGTNGGGALALYDIAAGFTQVAGGLGSKTGNLSQTNAGTTNAFVNLEFGQGGHPANADVQQKCYWWFGPIALMFTNALTTFPQTFP